MNKFLAMLVRSYSRLHTTSLSEDEAGNSGTCQPLSPLTDEAPKIDPLLPPMEYDEEMGGMVPLTPGYAPVERKSKNTQLPANDE